MGITEGNFLIPNAFTVISPRETTTILSSTPSSSTVGTVSIELTAHHLAATPHPRESAHKLKYEEVQKINNQLKEINEKTGGWFKFGLNLLKFVYVVTVIPCVIGSFFDGWGHLSNWQQEGITKRIQNAKDAYFKEKATELQDRGLNVSTLTQEVADYKKIVFQTGQVSPSKATDQSQAVKSMNQFYQCLDAFDRVIGWACKLKEGPEENSLIADNRIIKEWLDHPGSDEVIRKMGKFLPNELQIKERNSVNDTAFIKNLPKIQEQLKVVITEQVQFRESIHKEVWEKGVKLSESDQLKIQEKFSSNLKTMESNIGGLDEMIKNLNSVIEEIGIRNDPVVSEGVADLGLLVLGALFCLFG